MMVTPSGARVQFRQTVVTNVFETADSSYTQLVVNNVTDPNDASVEGLTITVRTTDGTQMSYVWNLGAYRCTEIKDRNGNYITIGYDGDARVNKVTDTLGREIDVSYDSTTGYPSSFNFPRKANNGTGTADTNPWVSFTYTDLTINTSFDTSLSVVGPPNGTVIKVLERLTYADGSTTRFSHNGYGQV